MWYALVFLLGGIVFAVGHWFWEFMTGPSHAGVVRELDEYKASRENQRLVDQFLKTGFPAWSRFEIWERMGWIWKETRGLALRSGSLLALLGLGLFALLYSYIWFRTLLFPNPGSLRTMIASRVFFLNVLQKRAMRDDPSA